MQLQPWPGVLHHPRTDLNCTLLQCHCSGSHGPHYTSHQSICQRHNAGWQGSSSRPGSQYVNHCVSPSSCHHHNSQQPTLLPKTPQQLCSLSFLAVFSNQVLIVLRIQLISQAFHSITQLLSPSPLHCSSSAQFKS